MRGIFTAATAAAIMVSASAALAGPLTGPGTTASALVVDGTFQTAPPIGLGSVIDISGLVALDNAATGEFLAFDPSMALPAIDGLKLELGSANNGLAFEIAYDRALLAAGERVFDLGANDQTGTLIATITDTALLSLDDVNPTPEQINIGGLLQFTDPTGTYDTVAGAWLLNFSFSSAQSQSGQVNLVLSTDTDIIPTEMTEPGMLGVVGAGLLGIGMAMRRRT